MESQSFDNRANDVNQNGIDAISIPRREPNQETVGTLEKFATWVLVLSPILQTYGWGKYDFAFILTSLVGVIAIVKKRIHFNRLPQFLLCYFLYWLFIHAKSSSSYLDVVSLGTLKTILVYGTFFSVIPLALLIKYYKVVVKLSIAFFVIQLIIKFIFNVNFLGVFSFLPLALEMDAADFFADRSSSDRLSSFFSEPAMFAQYLVPYFCLQLFNRKINNNQKLISILLLIAIFLLMQSGNALFGLGACIFFFFLFRMQGNWKRKVQTVMFGIVIIAIGFYFMRTEIGEKMMSRKEQVSINSVENLGYSTSGFERIFKGYFIYAQYSTICKIIGNDNPQYKKGAAFSSEVGVFFSEETQDYLYCNTFQMVLLNTGLIGVFIMVLVFRGIWQTTNHCGKDLLLTFFAFSLFSASYFSENMCLYMLISTLMGRNQTDYE